MIKGIIFDMDGVMIDTENQSNLGWLWAASQKNVEMPLWLIDSFKGAPAKLSQSFFDDYYHGAGLLGNADNAHRPCLQNQGDRGSSG